MATHSSILAWEIPQTEGYNPWICKELDVTEHTYTAPHPPHRQPTDVSLAITIIHTIAGMTPSSHVYTQAILSYIAPEPAMSFLLCWTSGGISSHCCSLEPLQQVQAWWHSFPFFLNPNRCQKHISWSHNCFLVTSCALISLCIRSKPQGQRIPVFYQ